MFSLDFWKESAKTTPVPFQGSFVLNDIGFGAIKSGDVCSITAFFINLFFSA